MLDITANGNHGAHAFGGGAVSLFAQGSFDTGTLKVQWSLDGTNWIDFAGASLTDSGLISDLPLVPAGVRLRLNMAGAISPSVKATFGRVAALNDGMLNLNRVI